MANKLRWKFLHQDEKTNKMTSEHGNMDWKIGQWEHVEGEIKTCHRGFHCSKGIWQAFSYVQGSVLARVEVKGGSHVEDDKEAWSDMCIVKAYKWTKRDSVELAIFAAEQVIEIFEKYDGSDKRPREAIEAAKKYLADPSKKNQGAAHAAARAAYAADAAAHAAADAAHAAYAAAHAAHAAYAAAHAAAIKRIAKWMDERVKTLEEL